jgi:uncharacterized protein YaiI (UPF0178 family)
MRILVDADACPVKKQIIEVAESRGIEIVFYSNTSHEISVSYGRVVTVEQGQDSVDYFIIKELQHEDIVVTQDYGLASLVLGKKAQAINNFGLIFNEKNIERLLFERYLHAKSRKAGEKLKSINKRVKQDDIKFKEKLASLCDSI